MKITRMGRDKDTVHEVDRIEITVSGIDYIISDRFGELEIHACHDEIHIKPAYANVVKIVGFDRGQIKP